MRKLRPLISSEAEFENPKAQPQIAASLNTLEKQLSRNAPKGIENNPGFRITYDLLAQHLRQTKKAFDAKKLPYARQRLNATTNFCMTCHTQTPEAKASFFGPLNEDSGLKPITVSNAEYLFITRRYDQALSKIDALVRQYPKSDLKSDNFMDVYRRKLAIFARVYRKPKDAIANFKADLASKEIPMDVRRNVEAWIQFFENWQKEKEDPAEFPTDKLLSFVEKNMPIEQTRQISPADPDVVAKLRFSGLLYERLFKEGNSPSAQKLLFYLSGIERQLSPLYWYSLSDAYLRECVIRYPKQSYSQKCYDAFATDLKNRYLDQGKGDDEVEAQLAGLKPYL